MTVEIGQSTANDASHTIAANPGNVTCCSMEQIYSPIAISKSYNAVSPSFKTPLTTDIGPFNGGKCVGPTVKELNPYFSSIFGDDGSSFINFCDYNAVMHLPSNDLNLKKNPNRGSITEVRTQAFRGPMILSGWGFDIGDLPVPANNTGINFDPNLVNNRSYWKTGPVNLMWDDERQVWSGGYHIVCGVLNTGSKISAASSPLSPTTFTVKVLRRNPKSSKGGGQISPLVESTTGEIITCVNRDPSLSYDGNQQSKVFVIAIRLNYEWLPLWVGCP